MEIKESVGFTIRDFSLLLARYMEKNIIVEHSDNIRGPQSWALGFLVKNREKEIFQKDLEREMNIQKATASNLVARMKRNGYITTTNAASDRRYKKIVATEKAIQKVAEIDKNISAVEQQIRKGVSEEELAIFFKVVQQMKTNLQ